MSRAVVIAAALAALMVSGCTTPLTSSIGNGYRVEHVARNTERAGYATIEYKPRKMLVREAVARAADRMQPVSYIEAERQYPPGGHVIVRVTRPDIETASPDWHEIVIRQLDREVYRAWGRRSVPERPITPGSGWYGVQVIDLPLPVTSKTEVFVVDRIAGRDAFAIYPPAGEGS